MSPLAGAKIASRFHCGFAMIRRTADQRRSRSAREKIGIMYVDLIVLDIRRVGVSERREAHAEAGAQRSSLPATEETPAGRRKKDFDLIWNCDS